MYFRAKAHNSAGWGYGNEKNFQTPAPLTYHFLTSLVRAVVLPVDRAKIIREGIVVSLRKQYIKFETQTKLKSGVTL